MLHTLQSEASSSSEVFKGHIDLLVLAVLAGTPAHGYRVVEAVRARSDGMFDLAEGTVYPALHRLERSGLVRSRWQTVDGRRRRVYRLTRLGTSVLARRRREWLAFADGMAAVLT
jgi:PadR family transcriptional regulator, regulatory protein PadR